MYEYKHMVIWYVCVKIKIPYLKDRRGGAGVLLSFSVKFCPFRFLPPIVINMIYVIFHTKRHKHTHENNENSNKDLGKLCWKQLNVLSLCLPFEFIYFNLASVPLLGGCLALHAFRTWVSIATLCRKPLDPLWFV